MHLRKSFGKESIGLYREDSFAIIKNRSAHLADKTRKKFHEAFGQFGLQITAEEKFTGGKLSCCYFRPFHRKILTL